MVKTRSVLRWIILIVGIASLSWTIVLHGKLYGYSELPGAGSTLVMILATLLLMLAAFLTQREVKVKKGFPGKLIDIADRYADVKNGGSAANLSLWFDIPFLNPFFKPI